ncbi:hypothetical protein RHECNPAF_13600107 [Rhizobium etli CNPAF512]|nr:hypothetical protein RHECNPAF_13600107 [Rhizobium etli CNPAF512]
MTIAKSSATSSLTAMRISSREKPEVSARWIRSCRSGSTTSRQSSRRSSETARLFNSSIVYPFGKAINVLPSACARLAVLRAASSCVRPCAAG